MTEMIVGIVVSIRDAAMAPIAATVLLPRDFSDPPGSNRGPGFSLSPMASHPQRHRPLIGPGLRVKTHVHPNWSFQSSSAALQRFSPILSSLINRLQPLTFDGAFAPASPSTASQTDTLFESHKRHDRHHDVRLCCVLEGGPPEYLDLAMEPPSVSRSVSRDLRSSAITT